MLFRPPAVACGSNARRSRHGGIAREILPLALTGSILLASPAAALDGRWVDLTPSPRLYSSGIYDPVGDRLLIFGGQTLEGPVKYNEVWELSLSGVGGPRWRRIDTFGVPPSPRYGHTAIYDPVRRRMVVFGGADDGGELNDTWALSLHGDPAWTRIEPGGGPPGVRSFHSAIYETDADRMIVYGGLWGSRFDIWALSFGAEPSWSQFLPDGDAPPARGEHSAVYDAANDRMIVFGGAGIVGLLVSEDVWSLSLSAAPTWTMIVPAGAGPEGRAGHGAIYDAARARMLIFGGTHSAGLGLYENDVWELDLGAAPGWTEIVAAGAPPPPSSHDPAIYDPVRDRMIVYRGSIDNETWSLYLGGVGPEWVAGVEPGVRWRPAGIFDPGSGALIGFGGFDGSGALNDLWALHAGVTDARWSELSPSGAPPAARHGHSAMRDPLTGAMVVFGGTDGTSTFADVWLLSNPGTTFSSWTAVSPTGPAPAARHGHTSVYDASRSRMIVFGGAAGPTALQNDVWALEGPGSPTPVWSSLSTFGAPPSPRADHVSVYDPVRDALIVWGGSDGASYFNDTWSLAFGNPQGPTWTAIAVTGPAPARRARASAVYDPVRDRIVLFGGMDGTTRYGDIWSLELQGGTWTQLAPTGSQPYPREGHMVAYDSVRDRMLVFGGQHDSTNTNQASSLQWGGVVGVDVGEAPRAFHVSGFAPNPSLRGARVMVETPAPTRVRVRIHDIAGRLVATPVDRVVPAGRHLVEWAGTTKVGTRAGAGVYLAQIWVGAERTTRRLVLVR